MVWWAFILVLFGTVMILTAVGVWVPVALIAAALVTTVIGPEPQVVFQSLGSAAYTATADDTLTAIAMFIFMGQILLAGGISERAYRAIGRILRRTTGPALYANIVSCAVFSAITGSSLATASAMGAVGVPELRRRKYDDATGLASIAAGGTLGTLLPPSILMIVFASLTGANVVALFSAGIIPGVLTVSVFFVYLWFRLRRNPTLAGRDDRRAAAAAQPKRDDDETDAGHSVWRAALDLLPLAALIGAVLGSMYAGIATPTEAGAVGVFGALIVVGLSGKLTLRNVYGGLKKTVGTVGMVGAIIAAAATVRTVLVFNGSAVSAVQWIISLHLSLPLFLLAISVVYFILGGFIDSLGLVFITIPILLPVFQAYHMSLVLLAVLVALHVEIGQITPPVGLNLFGLLAD